VPPQDALLSPAVRAALGAVLAAGGSGARGEVSAAVAAARKAGAGEGALRETLLMLVPYAGYPRAIAAFAAARLTPLGSVRDEVPAAQRGKKGRAAFARVYGSTAARVSAGLRALDPRLPAWTLEFAYGRVLARPALALRDRELLAVSLLTGLGDVEDALLGHMRGAVRLGATRDDVAAAIDAVPDALGRDLKPRAISLLARL
jgi:alkylhydroperoxidase/carboxymuconolactone decarboxylase family protein YurZ